MNKNIIVLLLLLMPFALKAQVTGGDMFSADKLLDETLQNSLKASDLKSERLPVGNAVDPDYYYLGPGDMLSIQIIPMMLTEQTIMVSPQLSIALPRIAKEVSLAGKTLNQAKSVIDSVVKERSKTASVIVSLLQPRLCLVEIQGDVAFPGTYTMPASYSVSTALKIANKITLDEKVPLSMGGSIINQQQRNKEKNEIFTEAGIASEVNYKDRNITLLRKNGVSQIVDLIKADALNDAKYDPYIKEGDKIISPFAKNKSASITVSGAVLNPSSFAYKEGDKLSLVLKVAKGLTDNADLNNVYYIDPFNLDRQKIIIDSSLNLISSDFDVQPNSIVIIESKPAPAQVQIGAVSVKGEVKNPGIYPVVIGKTKLKDVIEAAGGFTQKAYLPLAQVFRRNASQDFLTNKRNDFEEEFRSSSLTSMDTIRFGLDYNYKKPFVSVDFDKAFNYNSSSDNILLADGDVIMAPEKPNQIYVYGKVRNPGYIEFVENKNADWYINQAGGYAEGADKKRTSIIRGYGRSWIEADKDEIALAGDDIYVPNPSDQPPGMKVQEYGVYIQSAFVIISIANLIFGIYQYNKSKKNLN